ncbi:hypothetical protein OCK74_08655 [Chitinophagaceae bacterium LB-8]|uniref:Uncharacterized protein n=1 Tax=Paraflavisolibacter caeni TaxID=2982496 RepID=A0A9X2XWW9_9BACT|nr:hypothetical protein [Paraflavisolibacter caeni]MCU7549183.1 hypothetical protein [Paraflavisolibacter caeni]
MKRYFLRRNKEDKGWFFAPMSQTCWFLVVTAVLMFDFFIIKAIVQGFESYPSDFIAIKNALQNDPPDGNDDKNYQNALVKEIIAASDTGIKSHNTSTSETKILSLEVLKKLLQVKNNKYHINSTGGIDDLDITVYNPSDHFIESLTVQIDYFQEDGKLVQTKAYTTAFVKPKSYKTIHIPSNTKGSKIIYRITNIKSSECAPHEFMA